MIYEYQNNYPNHVGFLSSYSIIYPQLYNVALEKIYLTSIMSSHVIQRQSDETPLIKT